MSDSPIEIVADQRAFDALLGDLDGVAELAIDTEFHLERTYSPHPAPATIVSCKFWSNV